MKKFLSVVLLAVGIIFYSQNFVDAAADKVYAFSEDGIDYYAISNYGGSSVSQANAVTGVLAGYKNGKEVNSSIWAFYCLVNNEICYKIFDENEKVLAQGKVKDEHVAIKVLAAILEKGK